MGSFKPRWYHFAAEVDPVPVQKAGRGAQLPRRIAALAYAEYARQGHGRQSFERILERSGFSWPEVTRLLADTIERIQAGDLDPALSRTCDGGCEAAARVLGPAEACLVDLDGAMCLVVHPRSGAAVTIPLAYCWCGAKFRVPDYD